MLCCFPFLSVEQHLWSILLQFIIMHQEPSHLLQWWVGNSFKGNEFWNSWFSIIIFCAKQLLSLKMADIIFARLCLNFLDVNNRNNVLPCISGRRRWKFKKSLQCRLGKLSLKFTSLEQPCRPTNPLITTIFWQMLLAGGMTCIWKHTSTTGHTTSLGLLDSAFVAPWVG